MRHLERDCERPTGGLAVCHIFSGDLWAGAEVMIFNLLSCLNEDASLRLLALSLNEGVLTEKLRAAGITTHVIPEAQHSPIGIVCRAVRLLKNSHLAIIHSHRYKENLLAWLLAKWLGVTELVTTIHGLPEPATNGIRGARLTRWKTELDYFVVGRLFACSVAVSNEMKRELVQRYRFRENQVRVIRNGGLFPPMPSPANLRGEYFHIGTVGRMVPVKGFELFLEIAAALRRETPFVRFSILGDGPLRYELARRASALSIRDCVEFVAPQPDAFAYYRSLDLYLNTSVHEGLPLSVVEAMACGKPIVASAVGGIPEIVTHGENGFLVEGREPGRFAELCAKLMRNEGLRRTMGERAEAVATSRLTAQAMAEAYRGLYDEFAARINGRTLNRCGS